MGLIKATMAAGNSTLADQWKEYFICEEMTSDVLIAKGYKQTSDRSSNKKGSDDIITNGSIISVSDGQAMMIVEDGKVVEFCAEPGAFKYDSSTEPTIFEGNLGSSIVSSFKTFGKRFTFGGESAKNQKVYYFNLKELAGNKFGTKEPIMYDDYIYQSIQIRFFGKASLRLDDPMKLYSAISGTITDKFLISDYWQSQLSAEFLMYLSQAMAKLAADNVKYNQITQKQIELASYMNEVLDADWHNARGLLIERVAIESVSLDPQYKEKIEKIDEMRLMSNTTNAAGRMTAATANALEGAAENEGGAMMGFAGVNMAMNNGNSQVMAMHQMAQNDMTNQTVESDTNTWSCSCGASNTGKFCAECGSKRPEDQTWVCSCGSQNTAKFCPECGAQKPQNTAWTCSCGSVNTAKFCPNCGSSNA